MANNETPTLAKLIFATEMMIDDLVCGAGAIGWDDEPNNPDGGVSASTFKSLTREHSALLRDFETLTGKCWSENYTNNMNWAALLIKEAEMAKRQAEEVASEGASMARAIEEGELRSIRASEDNPPARLGGSRNRFGQMEWF